MKIHVAGVNFVVLLHEFAFTESPVKLGGAVATVVIVHVICSRYCCIGRVCAESVHRPERLQHFTTDRLHLHRDETASTQAACTALTECAADRLNLTTS